jgi:hypothetical protein
MLRFPTYGTLFAEYLGLLLKALKQARWIRAFNITIGMWGEKNV